MEKVCSGHQGKLSLKNPAVRQNKQQRPNQN